MYEVGAVGKISDCQPGGPGFKVRTFVRHTRPLIKALSRWSRLSAFFQGT